jgi:pyruvate/oxaloacetate carboxyltransferase
MLNRLFGKKQPAQSQSISGVTAGGQVQVVQAGRDAMVSQSGQMATQGLSGAEVLALLEQLRGAIAATDIATEQKEEMLDYLKSAQREAGKEQPDKELVGRNLKQVGETMKTLKETTEAGKSLWQTGTEVLKAIAPWLGAAASLLA